MSRKNGLSLAEMLIAMAILLIVCLACLQVLQFHTRLTVATFSEIQANLYLDRIANHLRRSNVAKLENAYHRFPQIVTDASYSAEANIAPASADGSRQATITVHW